MYGTDHSKPVSLHEWIQYYRNISANIDNDELFKKNLNNVWNMDGKGFKFKSNQESGYKHMTPTKSSPAKSSPPKDYGHGKFIPNYESGMDPIHHEKPLYQQLGARAYRDSNAPSENDFEDTKSQITDSSFGFYQEPQKNIPKYQQILLDRLKTSLKARGVKGLVGFVRQLRLFDTSGKGELDLYEFKQALSDYEIEMIEIDIENLFKSFSHSKDLTMNINEFLETLIQPMNKFRYNLVKKAFNFLDHNNSGQIDINHLMKNYNASRHPEVTNFKKEKEEIMYEFQESFSMHHNLYKS